MRLPLQHLHIGYNQNCDTPALLPPTGKQVHIYDITLHNGSAATIDMGILKRVSLSDVSVYKMIVADTPDATLDTGLKNGVATKIFTTTTNDGFMIQSSNRFSLIGLNISTEGADGVYALSYFNGTAFVALTALTSPALTAKGTALFLFAPPVDWVPGTTAGVGGASDSYSVIVRASTAPGSDISANRIWVGRSLDLSLSVAAKSNMNRVFFAKQPLILAGEEGILPYFGGTASPANMVSITYSNQE